MPATIEPRSTPRRKRALLTPQQKALKLAAELDSGEWDEDLEPQEVAWLLRELVKLIEGK